MLTSGRDQLPASPLSYPELPQGTNIRAPRASTRGYVPADPTNADPLETPEAAGMADAVQQQLEQASTYEGLPFIEQLSLLVEHEQLSREQRKQARLVKQARLKLQATVGAGLPVSTQPGAVWVTNLAQGEVAAPGPEPAHYRPVAVENLPGLCAGLPSLSARA